MNLHENKKFYTQKPGVALILTMIVLVLLTALIYRLGSAVSQWKHRVQYMIDYQTARYACESGLKYTLSTISGNDPNYVSRPNEPDFSDLFTMSDEKYRTMMEEWAKKRGVQVDVNSLNKNTLFTIFKDLRRPDANDSNYTAADKNLSGTDFSSRQTNSGFSSRLHDVNDVNDANNSRQEPNELFVRGPYGPPWPYITKPVEIEFGDASVTIEIIDENAKLPLVWGISSDPNVKKETKAAIQTFCEWMQMEPNAIEPLMKELGQMKEIKPFSINLKPTVITTKELQKDSNSTSQSASTERSTRRSSRSRQRNREKIVEKVTQQTRSDIGNTLDFAKLLHSPMVDLETLAKPVNKDENRTESALKYISLWGTQKVNINTAPRQVLEAAFTFGGDAAEIAKQIIEMRRQEPFKDVNDLSKRLYSFNTSIDKAKPYITTRSDCFSIRVIATSGVAKVCATAGIKKDKEKIQQIGIIIE